MSGVAAGGRTTVVLVDDSREVRAVVRRTLESSGLFEVVAEGGDGSSAFTLVDRFAPAILLLDASMPRLDGIEALPGILALRPQTRVVLFTGFDEAGLAARARELGAADVIGKWTPLQDLPMRLTHTAVNASPDLWPSPPRLALVGGPGGGPLPSPSPGWEQGLLDEHVQQFRELFDRAAIGMATLTGTGTIVRANRALARLMSSSPEELVGVDYGRLTEHAGHRLDHALEDIVTSGEELATFEHQLPRAPAGEPSGTVRVTLAPIRDSASQVLYLFAQVQDISALRAAEFDLRRSEEMFRLLVAAVGEYAIFMLDVDGTVISWNAGAGRIKGYTAEEILGQHFRVFYPAWERANRHPEHNLDVALREGSFAELGWRLRKDGTQFWASVVITPVYDDSGTHVGFAKVTRDQSSEHEHEQVRTTSLAEQGRIMAITAHELRTPAAVIDGSVSTLLSSWDQIGVAERDALLGGIRSSANRLHRLASDLTTSSGPDGETVQLRLEDVSLTELLNAAAARMLAAQPGAQVLCQATDEALVRADPIRLGQALDNLLDNAFRHGAAPLTLTGSAPPGQIRIRVTDAGPGVAAELLPRLFQRFAVAGPSGATGLGLYLVREIARSHGGEARYHAPTDRRPTTFEISLPR
jgi:PAS domain S-box-containing protein